MAPRSIGAAVLALPPHQAQGRLRRPAGRIRPATMRSLRATDVSGRVSLGDQPPAADLQLSVQLPAQAQAPVGPQARRARDRRLRRLRRDVHAAATRRANLRQPMPAEAVSPQPRSEAGRHCAPTISAAATMSATIATKASDSQVGIVQMESSLMTTTDERERRRKARRLQREISRLGCHPISDPGFLKGVNATVRAIDLEGLGIGGRCLLHALVAAQALWNCNIAADLHIGSALCRVGPDPYRDVIAFCGPGNAGRGTQFHAWLEVGDDILDFSVGEW